MLEMYYCPKCKNMRMLSNHSGKKGRDICPACGEEHILADVAYAEWIKLDIYERDKCINAYKKAYPFNESL